MKLSSISLVVTAIAAIAGSAIAAPGPAYARALDAINSFDERDVDVNRRESGLALLEREIDNEVVDNLFTRGFGTAALEHEKAAKAWETIGQTAGHFFVKSGGDKHFHEEEKHAVKKETDHLAVASQHRSNKDASRHGQLTDEEKNKQAHLARTSIEEARSSRVEAHGRYHAILGTAREKGLHH